MDTANTSADLLNSANEPAPKLSPGLKVLTILTFIGCALQIGGGLWNFFNAEKTYKEIDKVVAQMNSESMPAWAKSMMGSPEHYTALITKGYENRIPIVLMALVAAGLCLFGAIQMRKLKKQGFPIYAIRELMPVRFPGLVHRHVQFYRHCLFIKGSHHTAVHSALYIAT
ncbi:MAG: hypothetical protein IPI66_07110 [Chitinophagaceae bacterium]|nr:hypothetical protein [Chitinophagaceae bacterium]